MEKGDKKEQYEYREYPKNVRQIGIPLPGTKVYLEDYVITYLKQCFVQSTEPKIVILLGKDGKEKVGEDLFIYGAIAVEGENILEEANVPKEIWDNVYQNMHENFSGAKVMGWACGVPVWNSQTEKQVRSLQKKEFAKENQILFLWDLGEKEEKMFLWQQSILKELSGYYVYFEKNPQMRDFMLDKPKAESIDGDYEDTVTDTMRHVMEKKEEQKKNLQLLSYCGMVAAGIVLVFGVHMMLDSTERIRKMEETVTVLSEYVDKQQEEVAVLSQGVEQEENSMQEISMEDQETPKPSAGAKTTASPDTKKEKRKKTSAKNKTQKKKTSPSKEETVSRTSALSHQQTQSYLVQKGDTLSQIVWRQYHDLSYEDTVKKVNGLSNADEIYEGQCLILPKK